MGKGHRVSQRADPKVENRAPEMGKNDKSRAGWYNANTGSTRRGPLPAPQSHRLWPLPSAPLVLALIEPREREYQPLLTSWTWGKNLFWNSYFVSLYAEGFFKKVEDSKYIRSAFSCKFLRIAYNTRAQETRDWRSRSWRRNSTTSPRTRRSLPALPAFT